MPFIGLSPFLRNLWNQSCVCRQSVSMPFIGLLPFLHEEWFTWEIGRGDVSMPFIRLLPFLLETELPGAFIVGSCQCPLSGFFHFYAPLWERPKMKICRLDFAGNCLTTSKSAYFLLFLCLFTLCSYFFVIFRP